MPGRGAMMRTGFEPGLRLGQYCVMLDATGPPAQEEGQPVFEVIGIEALPSAGPSGLLGLYSAGAAFPAGYTASADKNAVLNQALAAAGGTIGPVQPAALSVNRFQLVQARFKSKFLGLPAPPSIRDLDVQAWMGNIRRWTAGSGAALTGVINAIMQVADPNDVQALPAQGGALAVPAAFPGEAAWREALRTELWWYYNNPPAFALINNHSATAIAQGAGFAWFMEMVGFVYMLRPVTAKRMHAVDIGGDAIDVPISISREELLDGAVQINFRSPSASAIDLGV